MARSTGELLTRAAFMHPYHCVNSFVYFIILKEKLNKFKRVQGWARGHVRMCESGHVTGADFRTQFHLIDNDIVYYHKILCILYRIRCDKHLVRFEIICEL